MLLVSMCPKKSARSQTKRALVSPVGDIRSPGAGGSVGGLWDYVGRSLYITGFLAEAGEGS